MMRNRVDLIFNIERVIVHFVRLMVIILMITFSGCSQSSQFKISNSSEIIQECQTNIEYLLPIARVVSSPTDISVKLVAEYLASENGGTYYYYLFKIECKSNGVDKTIFATVQCSIKNDFSLSIANTDFAVGVN